MTLSVGRHQATPAASQSHVLVPGLAGIVISDGAAAGRSPGGLPADRPCSSFV
jgi:hypothetical protein